MDAIINPMIIRPSPINVFREIASWNIIEDFGITSVKGRNLVPNPPANMTAFILSPQ